MPSTKNLRVVITRLGGPEVLQQVEEEIPQAPEGHVRVRVLATGVAFADVLMRHGLYPAVPALPFAPGYDIVGEVDALGQGVTQVPMGQRVAALTMIGGYSRYTVVPAAHLVPVPEGLDPAEAVSLVFNYVTAYQMMQRVAKLASGQSILIHSAAGGVGTAALQLGRLQDLRMFGTASRPKHDLVRKFGAVPIDYRSEDFLRRVREAMPEGLHCVLDPIGGSQWWKSYSCLRRGGHLVCFGAQAAVTGGKSIAALGFGLLGLMKVLPGGRHASWYNIKKLRDAQPQWFREDLSHLFELLVARRIEPVIAGRFTLREAGRANELLEKSQGTGKFVILPQE